MQNYFLQKSVELLDALDRVMAELSPVKDICMIWSGTDAVAAAAAAAAAVATATPITASAADAAGSSCRCRTRRSVAGDG